VAKRKGLPKLGKTLRPTAQGIEAKKFASSQAIGDEILMTYDPTATTWPQNGWDHRRTTAAGYDKTTGRLRIEFFTDGSLYDYGTSRPVPPEVARQFRRAESPGSFINQILEGYGYERVR